MLVTGDGAAIVNGGGGSGLRVRVTVESLIPEADGPSDLPADFHLTPPWVAFHDGGFDAFDEGAPASPGIANLSQEGVVGLEGEVPGVVELFLENGLDPADLPPPDETIAAEFDDSDSAAAGGAQGQVLELETALGLFAGDSASVAIDLNDPEVNRYFSYGAMYAPSNDAFIGNDDPGAIPIFDEDGNFIGADFIVYGSEAWDSGTEVNDEILGNVPLGPADIGKSVPEDGTAELHPGFTPGGPLDVPGVDFSQPGFEIARFVVEAAGGTRIESDQTAVQIEGRDAEILNTGVMSGDVNGVSFVNGGESSGTLVNEGLITSLSRAVNIGGTGVTVINEGRIQTTADPRDGVIHTDATADDWTILNGPTGVIDGPKGGTATAVSLQLGAETSGLLVNDGHIQGQGEGSGVRLFPGVEGGSRFTGLIENAGGIRSEATGGIHAGVLVESGVSFAGIVKNAGEISGDWNGVYFGLGDHSDGEVVNEKGGVVTSLSRAVNIDGHGLTLVNEGTIATGADARNGVVYSNVSADGFRIENREGGVIAGEEGVNADAVSLELDEAVGAEVHNAGLVAGRGEAALSGQASGVRLFSPGGASSSPAGSSTRARSAPRPPPASRPRCSWRTGWASRARS